MPGTIKSTEVYVEIGTELYRVYDTSENKSSTYEVAVLFHKSLDELLSLGEDLGNILLEFPQETGVMFNGLVAGYRDNVAPVVGNEKDRPTIITLNYSCIWYRVGTCSTLFLVEEPELESVDISYRELLKTSHQSLDLHHPIVFNMNEVKEGYIPVSLYNLYCGSSSEGLVSDLEKEISGMRLLDKLEAHPSMFKVVDLIPCP